MPRKNVASTENIERGKESATRNVSLALQKADCYLNNNIIYIRPTLYCKQIASVNVAMFRSHSNARGWYLISLQLHHQVAMPSPAGTSAVGRVRVSSCKFQREIRAPEKSRRILQLASIRWLSDWNWAEILWEVLVLLFRFTILLFTSIKRTPKQI